MLQLKARMPLSLKLDIYLETTIHT